MSMVVGGLRARLIRDCTYELVRDKVIELGWQQPGRRHLPIVFRASVVPWEEEVPLNTVAISQTDVSDEPAEMGSNLSDDSWTFYVDLYAEDESVGTHLIHDIRDILRGKMPSIGRSRPILPVYNEDRTEVLFNCDIEEVIIDRANDFPKAWQRYWYVCRFRVVDTYGDEDDE
jgi:hypothetical protein